MRTQLSETSTSGFVLNFKGDQNQLATLDFVTISDYFVKDLAKCLHVFPSWFCALITIIIAKLKQNVIRPNWFNMNIFYKHGISCILVIVHRILREYQNWTEFKLHTNGAVRISCIFNPSECCLNSGPESVGTFQLSDYYTSMLSSNVKFCVDNICGTSVL